MKSDLAELTPQLRYLLTRYAFDEALFARLRAEVANGSLSATSNVVPGVLTPPSQDDSEDLPVRGDAGHREAEQAGLTAMRAGHVAVAVLNGGMATRFGGVVKGVVTAVGGRSFLEVKLSQVSALERRLEAAVPVVLMTSWATEAVTRRHLRNAQRPLPLCFNQYISLRLRPDGELFRTPTGQVSPYSTGHGDFASAIRDSGTLLRLREQGVRHVMVSNVDNVAARPDPVVLGMHVLGDRQATAEVVRDSSSAGGAPARVDGELRFLEASQFPRAMDRSAFPTNANTITFRLDALDRTTELAWLYARKLVAGGAAVQLERAYAATCDGLSTLVLHVPESGDGGRFLPIKTPVELESAQPALRRIVAQHSDDTS